MSSSNDEERSNTFGHYDHPVLAAGSVSVEYRSMSTPQFSIDPNEDVPYRILRATEDFLVIDKPAGVVTQPGKKHQHDALLNGLFAEYGKVLQNLGKKRDFGLLHRLDRQTSGLILVGLTPEGYDGLRQQFMDRRIEKTYLALVHGCPQPAGDTEKTPIREIRVGGRKRAALGGGRGAKEAVTKYSVLAGSGRFTLVKCHPKTGRLHQIRIHMAHRGCPIVGDTEYGLKTPIDRRVGKHSICLHAAQLEFRHPRTGKRVSVKSPVPDALHRAMGQVAIKCPRQWL